VKRRIDVVVRRRINVVARWSRGRRGGRSINVVVGRSINVVVGRSTNIVVGRSINVVVGRRINVVVGWSRSRRGRGRECCFWRVILNDVLLVPLFDKKDDLVVFKNPVVDVIPTVSGFSQSFMSHSVGVKPRDVCYLFQQE
jgi:hypothetical protein